jgi:ribosomal protein S27AE
MSILKVERGIRFEDTIPCIYLLDICQSILMEKTPQNVKVKRDRKICDRCQDPNVVTRPDGSYQCRRCGYDSSK